MQFKITKIIKLIQFQIIHLKSIKASPHQISLGMVIGIWVNFIPIVGVHILLALGISYIFRANLIAALSSVLITGTPIIFPFFWFTSWYIGSFFISESDLNLELLDYSSIIKYVTDYFTEMLLGSIILFPVIIITLYFPLKFLVNSWQINNLNKKMLRNK